MNPYNIVRTQRQRHSPQAGRSVCSVCGYDFFYTYNGRTDCCQAEPIWLPDPQPLDAVAVELPVSVPLKRAA